MSINLNISEMRCMLNSEKKSQLVVTQGLISKSEVTGAVTTISTRIQFSANDLSQRRTTVQKTIKCFQDKLCDVQRLNVCSPLPKS